MALWGLVLCPVEMWVVDFKGNLGDVLGFEVDVVVGSVKSLNWGFGGFLRKNSLIFGFSQEKKFSVLGISRKKITV